MRDGESGSAGHVADRRDILLDDLPPSTFSDWRYLAVAAAGALIACAFPSVMREGLYAIPALVGAAATVTSILIGVYGLPAAACFLIRLLGVHFKLNAPRPRGVHGNPDPPAQE